MVLPSMGGWVKLHKPARGVCSVLHTCVSARHTLFLLFKEILQVLGYYSEGHDTDTWIPSVAYGSQAALGSLDLHGWATYASTVAAI